MYFIIFLWQGGGVVGFFLSASISDKNMRIYMRYIHFTSRNTYYTERFGLYFAIQIT